MQPGEITDLVAELRALTTRPFAVNLWVSMEDEGAASADRSAFERCLHPLLPHFQALGGTPPAYKPYSPMRFEAQARAVIDAKVPVFSFICGVPPREILQACRAQGTRTVGAATTPDEAVALAEAGVDAIVASGFEAGGHRGAFLRPAEESLLGTFSLLPQVADVVDVPVVAAGGVADARGVLAALALGAEGVQICTALLACEGSGASRTHRQMLSSGSWLRTALTKGFTGRLARGIENQLMRELNRPGVEILPYPLQRALVKSLTQLAEPAGRTELVPMWAGQSASLSREQDAIAFLTRLVNELDAVAGPVLDWRRARRR
jgi:nitronate monooxygenase